jgi:hypothetical protein
MFLEAILFVILSKKVYMCMCAIPNGFTVQTSNTPCPHTSCKVHWCWRWNFRKCIVTCWCTWSFYVTCLRYWSLLNTNCNVPGYWRHRSVCYTCLFTTPLVVTTISVYSVLDSLTLCLWAVLWSLLLSVRWSPSLCSLFCRCLFSVCVSSLLFIFICPFVLSAAPQKQCLRLR